MEAAFDGCTELFKVIEKTLDESIKFRKHKDSFSNDDLFSIWRRLSSQSIFFDFIEWNEAWQWRENLSEFERHKFRGKYLIQDYLTEVLDELVKRLVNTFKESIKILRQEAAQAGRNHREDLSVLVRKEVRRQLKQELTKQNRKKMKKSR